MRSREQVKAEILAVAMKNFPRLRKLKITEKSNLYDNLGMDSLDLIELFLSVEEHFGVNVPEKETEGIKTLEEVVDLFYKKGRKK
jgi:acyl carrier protein